MLNKTTTEVMIDLEDKETREVLREILIKIFDRPELLNYLKVQLIENFFKELDKEK